MGANVKEVPGAVAFAHQKLIFNRVQIKHLSGEKKRANPLQFSILSYLCSPN
jgi:hypothetical protein